MQYGGNTGAIRNSYTWGLDGHLSQEKMALTGGAGARGTPGYDASATESMHWDGDQLLFTTNGNGNVDDIKIGDLFDLTFSTNTSQSTNHFISWFRDPMGRQTSCRVAIVGTQCAWQAPLETGYTVARDPWGQVLYMTQPDGESLSDGYTIFIGSRTYDTDLQQWTTPDVQQGNVDDPLSFKPFAFLHNNANTNSDPTGDDALCGDPPKPCETIGTVRTTNPGFQGGSTGGPGSAGDLGGLVVGFINWVGSNAGNWLGLGGHGKPPPLELPADFGKDDPSALANLLSVGGHFVSDTFDPNNGMSAPDRALRAASLWPAGRPASLAEQLTLREAEAGAGQRIMQGKINDPEFLPETVWAKMHHSHVDLNTSEEIVIHYWQNLITGARTGFKFK